MNDKCKMFINIGTGATGGITPDFMLANNLAYERTGGGTYISVKWYKQEAREYAEAFTLAAIAASEATRAAWEGFCIVVVRREPSA